MTCWTLNVPLPKLRRAYEIQMVVTPAVIIGTFTRPDLQPFVQNEF